MFDSNENFFNELYKENYHYILRYIYRLTKDVEIAQDIAQEVFLEAYRKGFVLYYHDNIKGWLYKTAKYKYLQYCSKNSRMQIAPIEEYNMSSPEIEDNEDYSIFEGILKPEEKKLLIAYYEYGYTLEEISKEMGISKAALKMRIQRIRRKVKNFFKKK